MEQEQWKNIDGFNGIYQISNLGRVKSLKCNREKILKTSQDRDGYLRVGIYYGKKAKLKYIHRLVLSHFKEPSDLHANHKNKDRTDNRLENLEWVTPSQNNLHKIYDRIPLEQRPYKSILRLVNGFERQINPRANKFPDEELNQLKEFFSNFKDSILNKLGE